MIVESTRRLAVPWPNSSATALEMHVAYSPLGIGLILAVAVLLSTNRKAIRLRVVGAAFAVQAGLAALVPYFPPGNRALQGVAAGVSSLLGYAQAGTQFLFGPLARPDLGGTAIGARPLRGWACAR